MTKKMSILLAVMAVVIGLAAGVLSVLHQRSVRDRNLCLNGMRMITAAVDATGLEKGLSTGAKVAADDFVGYLKVGRLPECPSGGKYTIPAVGEEAKCSVHGALKDIDEAQHATAP